MGAAVVAKGGTTLSQIIEFQTQKAYINCILGNPDWRLFPGEYLIMLLKIIVNQWI